VSATELDPTCDLDMGAPERYLADHVETAFDELEEPFFATIQFSNVHYPYYFEVDGPQPFQPWTVSKAPEVNDDFFNFYKNAAHQEDQHVASIIKKVRSTEKGKRTVIVYTSDHGEAFREHGQMGHTFSVLDEEIHVPAWVDAPPGTITEEQRANLKKLRERPTFHVDLTATILDVMGFWEAPEITAYRKKMVGVSLLRGEQNRRPMPLTNCAGVWSCAFENWGIMQENRKLEARSWDHDWHCYDVLADPYELNDLGDDACSDLHGQAVQVFGRLPGREDG
jgi:arylsulfatase A-like enzyme